MDILEIDFCSTEYIQEICDYRQPTMFQLILPEVSSMISTVLDDYLQYEINVVENKDTDTKITIQMNIQRFIELRKQKQYQSLQNESFLMETGFISVLKLLDSYIRPSTTVKSNYDIIFANKDTYTPYKYSISYRTFIRIEKGSVKIKLIPPRFKKYIYPEDNYTLFDFTSPINPEHVQDKYKPGFSKIKSTEKTLHPNDVFYIPAYWYYSLLFEEESIVTVYNYLTPMNILSILPVYIRNTLHE